MQEGLKKRNFLNYSILVPYLILALFGLVMVFSTTVPMQTAIQQPPYKLVQTQAIFLAFSLFTMWLIYRVKLAAFKSSRVLAFFMPIEIILLVVARFAPAINGAHGWIRVGALGTIQPAEFLKLFVVWYLASIFSKRQKVIRETDIDGIFETKHKFENFYTGWRLPIFIMLALVVIMPDIGNAVIVILVILTLISCSGISYRWAAGYSRVAAVLIGAFFALMFATQGNVPLVPHYITERFKAFLNPFAGLLSYGTQMANSYFAISNGGWFGRGLGNSIEKKGYLTFASTDFIFPVVVEEIGIIGAFLILGVLFFMILRIMLVGIRARDPFNAMIAIGVGAMLLVQTSINVGGAIGVIPETGVTFPFLSQGGSSLLVLSIAVAFVLNVSADEKRRELLALTAGHKRSDFVAVNTVHGQLSNN